MTSLTQRSHPLKSSAKQRQTLEEMALPLRFEAALQNSGLHPLRPTGLDVLQINVGKLCNQTCRHCHVDAGPDRTEVMSTDVVDACMRGDLVFNNEDEPVFTPSEKSKWTAGAMTFHERTGATLSSTDGKGKNQDVAKTFAAMGQICGMAPKMLQKLKGRDYRICEAIFLLLMA